MHVEQTDNTSYKKMQFLCFKAIFTGKACNMVIYLK